jgi:hypothetical protein
MLKQSLNLFNQEFLYGQTKLITSITLSAGEDCIKIFELFLNIWQHL